MCVCVRVCIAECFQCLCTHTGDEISAAQQINMVSAWVMYAHVNICSLCVSLMAVGRVNIMSNIFLLPFYNIAVLRAEQRRKHDRRAGRDPEQEIEPW